jgi:acyl-CoA-binding protein
MLYISGFCFVRSVIFVYQARKKRRFDTKSLLKVAVSTLAMGLKEDFEAAAERIKPVTGPNNDEMLDLYALYKQALNGDNTTGKPGLLDLKGRKKWDAWASKKGMSSEDAMKAYIELVDQLIARYAPAGAAAPA